MAQQKQEQDLNQLLKVRRDKLADLQANGKDPFQITKFNQTHHSMEVKSLYEAHEAELLKDRAEVDVTGLDEEQAKEAVKKDYEERREIMDASPIHVAIAGRMMFKRVMGKASFCNIQDLQGNIQVYVARDAIGADSYADFKKSDIGDIFGLEGFAFRTRTGEISIHAESITVMMQKEVADRIKASPGNKTYGAISAAVQYDCEVEQVISVPKEVFVPRPKVDSAVLKLTIRKETPVDLIDEKAFFACIKAGFGQRRKTLLNSLTGTYGLSKDEIRTILEKAGIDPVRRAETLDMNEFADIANGVASAKQAI